MRYVELGAQGLIVSALGVGCMGMTATYGPADEQGNLATLARALDLGYVTAMISIANEAPANSAAKCARRSDAFMGPRARDIESARTGLAKGPPGAARLTMTSHPTTANSPIKGPVTRLAASTMVIKPALAKISPPITTPIGAGTIWGAGETNNAASAAPTHAPTN